MFANGSKCLSLVFSLVDLYLVVVTKQILFTCVFMHCLLNVTHSGWKIKVVKVFQGFWSLCMLGFQKGWDSVKKHIKAIRSPCFLSLYMTIWSFSIYPRIEIYVLVGVMSHSQAVSHPSTNQARPCLASEIGRDRACSGWYGRKRIQRSNAGYLKKTHRGCISERLKKTRVPCLCLIGIKLSQRNKQLSKYTFK